MWKAMFAVGFALVSILACSNDWRSVVPTYGGYEAQLQALVGKSINDAVMTMGAPTRTVELAQGHRLYVWEQMSDAHTAVQGTKRWDPQTQQEEIVLSGGDRIPFDCTTQIEADGAGTVARFEFHGVACLGQTPLTTAPAAAPLASTPTPSAAPPTATAEPAVPVPVAAPPTGTPALDALTTGAERRAARREERERRREGAGN